MNTQNILNEIEGFLKIQDKDFSRRLSIICQYLHQQLSYYDWVGFYFAKYSTRTLHLGPFAGKPTDHIVIPFGKGICGQVAESHKSFLVEDVQSQDNYIACSLDVKSEIVVPLFVNNKNIGQIDIDSKTANAFSDKDENLLKSINELITQTIQKENIDILDLVERDQFSSKNS